MPIPLGILAAAGARQAAGSAFQLLETQVLSGNQSSITFSNLGTYASTYEHLQVRFVFRQTSDDVTMLTRLNGATSTYNNHFLRGNGLGVDSGQRSAANAGAMFYSQDYASAPANAFYAGVVDLLDPFSTTKNKTIRTFSGATGTGGSQNRINLTSTGWFSTDSVTSWAFSLGTGASPSWQGQSFTQFSRFSLYGIRGS